MSLGICPFVRIRGEHFDPILEVFPLLKRNFTQIEAKKKCDYVKKHLMDPEKKLLNLSATKRRLEDPAAKVKNLNAVKERLKDPSVKQKNLKAARERLKDPEKKEKNLQAAKARYYRLKEQKLKGRSSMPLMAQMFFDYINDHCLEFICFSCEQVFYRDQVEKVSDKFASKLSGHELLGTLTLLPSVESNIYVCKTCRGYLQKCSVPPDLSVRLMVLSTETSQMELRT